MKNSKNHNRVHFVGIGGIGMSALAHVLVDKGFAVSGSDLASSYLTEHLVKKGIQISIGHNEKNIEGATTVVYSSDVVMQNPECKEAIKQKVRLIHRAQLLAELMESHTSILVSGTHGKTTTSSLLTHLFVNAKFDPSYAIGGMIHSLGSNGAGGHGNFFIAEADESDGSFLKYTPTGAIITNIDNDHLEYWKNKEELLKGFKKFADQVKEQENLFWCKDDKNLSSLNLKGYNYGFSKDANLAIDNFGQKGWTSFFDFTFKGKRYLNVEISLIGAHNVLNAAATFGSALQLGVPEEAIRTALKTFSGIGRRVEKKGEAYGISFYDDYAHHPTEIVATLNAVRAAIQNKQLLVAFQPHRYTRVRDCLEQFPEVFDAANVLLITDIFSAREEQIPGITTEYLVEKIKEKTKAQVHYVPRKQMVEFCLDFLEPNDVFITMGAGDITKVGSEILKHYENSSRF